MMLESMTYHVLVHIDFDFDVDVDVGFDIVADADVAVVAVYGPSSVDEELSLVLMVYSF